MKLIRNLKIKIFVLLISLIFTFFTFAIKVNKEKPKCKKRKNLFPLVHCNDYPILVPKNEKFVTSSASIHRDISFRNPKLFEILNSNSKSN
jgi:hypothetical protein